MGQARKMDDGASGATRQMKIIRGAVYLVLWLIVVLVVVLPLSLISRKNG